jgi:hypothetical protein
MVELLATAHTWRGGDGPYSIAPIAGLLLTLLLIRTILRLPVGLAAVGASAVLGTLFATLGDRWGYVLTLAWWIAGFALLAAVRRAPGPLRRNPSD